MKENEANYSIPTVLITYMIILLTLQSCSTVHISSRKSNFNLKSLVLSGYGSDTYQADSVQTYLEELKDLGANTASFLFTCYVNDLNDTDVDCDSFDSPRLDRLSEAIKRARSQNFIVSLRVYIDLLDRKWRCYWNPKDKRKTFKNIKVVLSDFAKYAEDHKLDIFILGAEYCKLSGHKYTHEWKSIIKDVRKNFNGKITYGANWGPIDGVKEWEDVGFWKDLDYIGIDHYQPLPDLFDEKEIIDFQKQNFLAYQRFARKLEKPLILTELGFSGHSKGHLQPFEWRLKGKSDEKRQGINFKATLKALAQSKYFSGVYIWRKASASPKQMLTYDKDALAYELYHRKAWYEIQDFFNSY